MTIYKATKSIYHYWKDSNNGGWVDHTEYFMTEDKAQAWANDINKWFNMNNEPVEVDKDLHKGWFVGVEAITVNE